MFGAVADDVEEAALDHASGQFRHLPTLPTTFQLGAIFPSKLEVAIVPTWSFRPEAHESAINERACFM